MNLLINNVNHFINTSNTKVYYEQLHRKSTLLTFNRRIKLQSNGPLYSNTVIGTLAVDRWAVTFGTAWRGLCGAAARPGPSSLYQM